MRKKKRGEINKDDAQEKVGRGKKPRGGHYQICDGASVTKRIARKKKKEVRRVQ